MKYKFGVMSSLYELESESLRTAKLAMVLYLKTSAPIVIYGLMKEAFSPTDLLISESNKPAPEDLMQVTQSIKDYDANCENSEVSE